MDKKRQKKGTKNGKKKEKKTDKKDKRASKNRSSSSLLTPTFEIAQLIPRQPNAKVNHWVSKTLGFGGRLVERMVRMGNVGFED